MPTPVQEAAVEAVEVEAFGKSIPDLIQKGTTLYSYFQKNVRKVPVSNVTSGGGVTRPAYRSQFRYQGGSPIQQGTGDGDAILRGSGSNWGSFALSPVFMYNVCEITRLAMGATNGKDRALFQVKAKEMKNSLDAATQGIDAQLYSDGSGAIDTIPATATINNNTGTGASTSSIVGMNVAFRFTDQQVVQPFPAVGGTARGSATVSYVDATTNTVYFSTPLPSGTTNGDILVIQGSAGTASASIPGLKAWHVNGNTGSIGGFSRATAPGRISTPTINLNGGALTPNVGERLAVYLGRALGPDNSALDSAVWIGPAEQAVAIANLYYNVQITQNIEKGESAPDRGRRYLPKQYCGREYMTSFSQDPSRIDLFLPEVWEMPEMIPLQLYDFGSGTTVMPVPAVGVTNGTYYTSFMFMYETCFTVACLAPRAGAYIQQAAIPAI